MACSTSSFKPWMTTSLRSYARAPVAHRSACIDRADQQMLRLAVLGLCVLSYMGVPAQEPALPGADTHRFIRELEAIVEQSARFPSVTVVGVVDLPGAGPSPLLPLDTVLRIGQRPITSIADVVEALASVTPGTSFDLVIRRDGEERTLRRIFAQPR